MKALFSIRKIGDEGFCVSKEDGIYADPEDETAFYVCEGEKPTKKFCPTGLKFNPVISGCDIPEDVKYVGNEGDSSETSNSKEDSRWTTLTGNEGLKVLSVGGRQEPQKDNSHIDLQLLPPHKLFSIHIFNGAHSQTTNKLHEGRPNNAVEIVTPVGSIPKENYRKPADVAISVHGRLQNDQSKKISETPSIYMAKQTESANSNNLSQGTGRLEDNHRGESKFISQDSSSPPAELNPKIPIRPSSHNFSSTHPESSDNRKLQADQDGGNTNSLEGHLAQPPHKVFAINIYGSHPQSTSNENQMLTPDQNGLSGVKEFELGDQYRDTSSSNNGHNVLSAGALGFENGHGNVLGTPELKPVGDYRHEHQSNADLGAKIVEENVLSTNDSTTPLHFKLKINMDNSGKQPVINCTLSECSENDFAIEDYKTAGKGSESHTSGSTNESNEGKQKLVHHHDNHGSQIIKEGGDFQVTLTTDTSKPVAQPQGIQELPVAPKLLARPSITFSHTQKNNPPQLVGMKGDNVSEHVESNKETKMASNLQEKLSYDNREESNMKSQGNRETTKGGKVIQPGEKETEVKATNLQKSLAGESSVSSSLVVDEHSARKFENGNQITRNENNFHAEGGHDEQKENLSNTKLKTGTQENSLTNQLVNNNIKNEFYEQGQLNSQDFVQIQNHPQLKIILKNPGKVINNLKRRSDAKGHIVQILKSLIDRPLNLGSKNKEVASMLSTLVNKQVQGQKREKTPQDDSEAIKDSGSIAESILEANKEYLDAIAMQGMVFSDGDPETENMTNAVDSYQANGYQQQQFEDPQMANPAAEGRTATTGFHEESPRDGALQETWLNDEQVKAGIKGSGGGGK